LGARDQLRRFPPRCLLGRALWQRSSLPGVGGSR
jgi:hypothetical protein